MAIPKKYAHLTFVPPAAVAKEAEKGLGYRREFGRGGTMVGVARARDLKNRRRLSPSTIKRMFSFFSRHNVDKLGKNFGNEKNPSNGYIAWLLWGGDVGFRWVKKLKKEMDRAEGKKTGRRMRPGS